MSRIQQIASHSQAQQRKMLIPYIMAGDPDLAVSLELMHALVDAGADIIELGIPFSDPSADGPVIQLAAERSLGQGTDLAGVLTLVAQFRASNQNTAIVLMGYLNPIEIMGYEHFASEAEKAGVDGVLVVDMPPQESQRLVEQLKPRGIDTIFLVAPTTKTDRLEQICEHCSGYLYYVSLKGVTGAALIDTDSVKANILRLRQYTDLPVVIGFGIKDDDSAKAMAELADGVIIGSALVQKIASLSPASLGDKASLEHAVALIASARKSIDNIK
ncbi:MAG: tryptophan synthase subunit alpha [SAR86 cluster bacterium]|uniref:Tryptophan synthase alpha chain n=1 Tax=SAR86 cluster bacterium TaxID=2030880 RepID=A0A2A4MG34_9GAMM|nr:MAG: tryptophan synthase subunit alpha [SAR86 cluster bacterium]